MFFAALQKFTLSDFPGHVSAMVFTAGCNFRCPFCHNPSLVRCTAEGDGVGDERRLHEDQVLAFLRQRAGRLQGLVVTGGEPTLHAGLPAFLRQVKNLGYAVKLDTNGSRHDALRTLVDEGLVDYVAMDVKAPLADYHRLAGTDVDREAVARSIELLVSGGVRHEFRTTAVRPLLGNDDILAISELLRGASSYILQPFRPGTTLDASLATEGHTFADADLAALSQSIVASGLACSVR